MRYLDLRFDMSRGGLNENEIALGPVYCLLQICNMALNAKSLTRSEIRLHAKLQDKLEQHNKQEFKAGTVYEPLELSDDEFKYLDGTFDTFKCHSQAARLANVMMEKMDSAVREKPATITLEKDLVAPKVEA